MTTAFNYELLAKMPWLNAPHFSIWEVTGVWGTPGGKFIDCLALAQHAEDGSGVFFTLIPGSLDGIRDPHWAIMPHQITRARELLLVDALTGEAYDE